MHETYLSEVKKIPAELEDQLEDNKTGSEKEARKANQQAGNKPPHPTTQVLKRPKSTLVSTQTMLM